MIYFFFFRSGACVNADAATDFCALVDFGFRRILAAFEATLLDVFSFFAMALFLSGLCFPNVKPDLPCT